MGFIDIHYHYFKDHFIIQKLETLMADVKVSIKDLSAKVDLLQADLDAEQQQVVDLLASQTAAIDSLNQTVADLKGIIEATGTPEEIQAVSDKIDAVIADLQSTIPDAPAPPVA